MFLELLVIHNLMQIHFKMILWLSGAFDMTPAWLYTIRIPTQSEGTAVAVLGQISGWGETFADGQFSPVLRMPNVVMILGLY